MANCLTSLCNNLSRTIVIRIVALVVVVSILGGVIVVILSFIKPDDAIGNQHTKCETQSGSQGTCGEKHNCQSLHVTLAEAQCGQGMFCCPAEHYTNSNENCTSSESPGCGPNHASRPREQSQTSVGGMCKMSSALPDPASRCCGVKSESKSRIIGGSPSPIDDYPWTAALEYESGGVSRVRCGGSLISGRHVLTAAHCVDEVVWTLKNVRLGDYNISHPGKDCVPLETGGQDCTDDVVIVPVENIILHSSYNKRPISNSDDIALIRLDRIVNYTDFVRPICLPSVDFTNTLPTDGAYILYVAGWGSDNINESTEVKVSVDLPYVPQQKCQASYEAIKVRIGDDQLCAGGIRNKDTCKGDSGGPLMMENGTRMELVGIVSFGSEWCGTEGTPGVYTKVYAYLTWISDHISP